MIQEEELARLQRVAQNCAVAAKLGPVLSIRDVVQEAMARFLRQGGGESLTTEAERCAYLIGIVRNVCSDEARKWARRRTLVATESEIGQLLSRAVANQPRDAGEIAGRARRALAGTGLADMDVELLMAARVDGKGWKCAGADAGLTADATERARKRISKFLSVPRVIERFLDALEVEARWPRAPEPPSLSKAKPASSSP